MIDSIDVRRYDLVVRLLSDFPDIGFQEAARQASVSAATVEKIWSGEIPRPPVVVLERLARPRRCPDCGSLCSEWPCIFCAMRRRKRSTPQASDLPPVRFKYRRESK